MRGSDCEKYCYQVRHSVPLLLKAASILVLDVNTSHQFDKVTAVQDCLTKFRHSRLYNQEPQP